MRCFFVRVGSRPLLFDDRMPLVFGVINGHLQTRIPFLDRQRYLRSSFICSMPGFQLTIDRNMKLLYEGRLDAFWRCRCRLIDGNCDPSP